MTPLQVKRLMTRARSPHPGGQPGRVRRHRPRHQRHIYQLVLPVRGQPRGRRRPRAGRVRRAYRALGGFKGQSAFGTWLHRIGVNVCLNRKAVKTPRFETARGGGAVAGAEHGDAVLLRGERAARVRAAIVRLPRKQRATLILRTYHDLPHEEIAGILGSSVGRQQGEFFSRAGEPEEAT